LAGSLPSLEEQAPGTPCLEADAPNFNILKDEISKQLSRVSKELEEKKDSHTRRLGQADRFFVLGVASTRSGLLNVLVLLIPIGLVDADSAVNHPIPSHPRVGWYDYMIITLRIVWMIIR
jgi:hypothetical protein